MNVVVDERSRNRERAVFLKSLNVRIKGDVNFIAGPLIRAMIDNMLATQNGASRTKMYLYSGHESNIAAILQALQVYKPHVPEYSSALIMELHQIDSDYYVKVSVFANSTLPCVELTTV